MKIIPIILLAAIISSCTREHSHPVAEYYDYSCNLQSQEFDSGEVILRAGRNDSIFITGVMPGVFGFKRDYGFTVVNEDTIEFFDLHDAWVENTNDYSGYFVVPSAGWYRFNFNIEVEFVTNNSADFVVKISGGERFCFDNSVLNSINDGLNIFSTKHHYLEKDMVVFFDVRNENSSLITGFINTYFSVEFND